VAAHHDCPAEGERYRGLIELAPAPGGGGVHLVSSPFTSGTHILSAAAVRLVQGCRTFATLQEHALRLCGDLGLGPEQESELRQQLAALARAGFLLSPRQLAEHCRRLPPSPEPLPRIRSVGIPTRDRTASLGRCLTGFIENGLRHGRSHDYVVSDDSHDPDRRRANRLLLRSLGQRFGVEMAYAGPEEKTRFAEALVRRAGLPADAVAFGLHGGENCPITIGAGRNALLLHTAGDLLLQVDDDTLCRPVPAPGARPGRALSSRFDPTAFWFFAEDEPLPEGDPDEDFLAAHEQLLGHGPAALVGAAGPAGLDFDKASTDLFRKLEAGGQVVVTAGGLVGDSGMGSPLYLLALGGEARARLLRCERTYRHALGRGPLLRAVAQATVCPAGFCMAANLGLDNRRLLPPFLPVQRLEDGLFGAVVRVCWPGGLFGFLPQALLHLPPAPRRWSSDELCTSVTTYRSGQIIQMLPLLFPPGRGTLGDNLRELGQALADLGGVPLPEFEGVVRRHAQQQMSQLAGQLEGRLRQFGGEPAFWADDVRRVLRALGDFLAQKGPLVAADLREAFGAEQARPLLQRLVRRLGGLLRCWPDLVEAAKDLRAAGLRLAQRV
jgi:hypothetical protein